MTAESKAIEQLQNVQQGIAEVVAAKERLQAQEQTIQQQVVKLDAQTRQALAAGRKDLAGTALEAKNRAQTGLQTLDGHIQELEAQQTQLTDSEQKLRQKIEAYQQGLGSFSWWQTPAAFGSLGFTKSLTLNHVSYYGGWPGHQLPEGKSNLVLRVDVQGIALRKIATIFTIPWSEISDIATEGPEEAQRRFTATRLVALGPLGLAFKKDRKGSKEAIVTVVTRSGDEAIFHVAKTLPREIAPKLEPLAIQARRASKSDQADCGSESGTPAEAAADIPAQLEKLAELKDKGILTDDEFAAKKAELLARM